ncbi:MAG TPA: class I SAM-dependent methyltransferase [Candidatus Dormibacteraeota bacterium]|nr:class I SAM-dependent methyltransferase [Candidatus Dormibacteraeota bacterium]
MRASAIHPASHPRSDRTGAAAGCPNCGSSRFTIFHEVAGVPVHSCLLLDRADQARAFPTGNLALGFCRSCGFIFNSAYDPAMRGYAAGYEEQQSFSPRFNGFARQLAGDLIDRYELKDKRILEIGCGKGDFLALLCELGGNEGIGVDPACDPQRVAGPAKGSLQWIPDYYSEAHGSLGADLVCCRHTLEHIPNTFEFLRLVRRAIGERPETLVFFEVPDVGRVLREIAFWDIYYEHCSYFTLGSLASLFASCDFSVLRARKGFDDQYLLLDARPRLASSSAPPMELDLAPEETEREVERFVKGYAEKIGWWRRFLQEAGGAGKRVAIWGSSSKCVSFLTTLGIGGEIDAVVDINPYRHGKFLPGSGHQIRPPEFLRDYRPDVVILMNPIYREEVGRHLRQMGLAPEIVAV